MTKSILWWNFHTWNFHHTKGRQSTYGWIEKKSFSSTPLDNTLHAKTWYIVCSSDTCTGTKSWLPAPIECDWLDSLLSSSWCKNFMYLQITILALTIAYWASLARHIGHGRFLDEGTLQRASWFYRQWWSNGLVEFSAFLVFPWARRHGSQGTADISV